MIPRHFTLNFHVSIEKQNFQILPFVISNVVFAIVFAFTNEIVKQIEFKMNNESFQWQFSSKNSHDFM